MKKLLILISLVLSTATFAKSGDACNPGAKVLEKAALMLAKSNNPEAASRGELSAKLDSSATGSAFKVVIDDNYGLYDTVIVTEESSNGSCRIKSITEL